MKKNRIAPLLTLATLLLLATAASAHICYDTNGTGVVDAADSLNVWAYQGAITDPADPAYDPDAEPYDLNQNGIVGCVDRYIVTANAGDCSCIGDVDRDGDADLDDFDIFEASDPTINCGADVDRDGEVTNADGDILLGCVMFPGAGVVPEAEDRFDLDGSGGLTIADALAIYNMVIAGDTDCQANVVPDSGVNALDEIVIVHTVNSGNCCP